MSINCIHSKPFSKDDNKIAVFRDNGAVIQAINIKSGGDAEEIIDPQCDPNNPKKISFQDVTSAALLIKDGIEKTPCPVCDFSIYVNL